MRIRQAVRLLFLVGVAMIAAQARSTAQVSPGPLAHAHRSLEGTEHCLDCHGRGEGALSDRCTACHEEIAFQRKAERGLHGDRTLSDCGSCHPDHAGVEFEMIDWGKAGRAGFDHRRTGWPLGGAHAETRCRDCHKAAFQSGPVAALIKGEDRDRSWLGLERSCAGCHADPHAGRLDPDCSTCHDTVRWSPAPRFEHATTRFPLSGRHGDLECLACHRPAENDVSPPATMELKFGPLAHAQCSDCHDDPHRGRLGAECESCHTTQDFKQVRLEGFDHSQTRFALQGRHADVACESCHDPTQAWGQRPAFGRCEDCHTDRHRGEATLAGRAVDCDACHSVRGFEHATYTSEDHRDASYPLDGAHADVACRDCHRPSAAADLLDLAGVQLRPAHENCTDCHADAHANQLSARSEGSACESCHHVQGWRPSTFDELRHANLDLPLVGKHAEIGCVTCHGESRPGLPAHPDSLPLGSARLALTGIESDCVSCHFDPHQVRFAECKSCHGWEGFRPSAVDVVHHQQFEYPLEGAHRSTPCNACHAELNTPPSNSSLLLARHEPLLFEQAHGSCEACHESPHAGQFASRADGGTCQSCHDSESFRPASRFDHDRQAAFATRGAHATLECAACHRPADGEVGGVILYRPLPHRCQDCHVGSKGGSS